MFGSKLRNWMENHIVRPRKKGNKNNKHGTNNLATSNNTSNITSTTTNTTNVSSHAQPSINCRTDGTAKIPNGHKNGTPFHGDASSTSVVASPARRSEVSPIQYHTTSRAGWQSPQDNAMPPQPEQFLPHYHMVKQTSPIKVASSPIRMSKVKSSYTLENQRRPTQTQQYSKSVDANYLTDEMDKRAATMSNQTQSKLMDNGHHQSSYHDLNDAQYDANQLIENQNVGTNKPNKYQEMNQNIHYTDPLDTKKTTDFHKRSIPTVEKTRYGKLLPSNRSNAQDPHFKGSTYDKFNANIQFQAKVDNSNCVNNNNAGNNQRNAIIANNKGKSSTLTVAKGGTTTTIQCTETNRHLLKTNRYSAASILSTSSGHQLAHVINSLSSPESAYSTGYSTDGTSPGTTYTPECYINMRTGAHYFPRGVSTVTVEHSRYKFGLNKIDEGSGSEISFHHRRTESCDLSKSLVVSPALSNRNSVPAMSTPHGVSPDLQRRLAIHNYKGFESPSPRQRCRIRTNPWIANAEAVLAATTNQLVKKMEEKMDTISLSSGIKSSSGTDEKNDKNNKISETDSSSSSSTEVEGTKSLFTPTTIRKKKLIFISSTQSTTQPPALPPRNDVKRDLSTHQSTQQESDEDATLNEMMGKFDESYIYEKETDILSSSDSDPTECVSDLDTGLDAEDECDTDELLDIDFIDTGSIQEIFEKDVNKNTGSCTYYNFHPPNQQERKPSKVRRNRKQLEENSSKRKKRLTRKKKCSEGRENSSACSRRSLSCSRESRSLGGTPVSLRRNQSEGRSSPRNQPLSNRSNSLTFTEIRGHILAISESEKALLKADLEADVKYKQLIHEAETILVSMKTSALREMSSPRRICNVPTNKRVEMLRNCEADLKLVKAQKSAETAETLSPLCKKKFQEPVPHESFVLNRRLEVIRSEIASSVPESPKPCRFSPRKTHVSNFIHNNTSPTDLQQRRKNGEQCGASKHNQSERKTPPKSPTHYRRRFRSQSPKISIESDTDSENENQSHRSETSEHRRCLRNEEKVKKDLHKDDVSNHNYVRRVDHNDVVNKNIPKDLKAKSKRDGIIGFRSIGIIGEYSTGTSSSSASNHCPQSEPLKRKIYTGSKTFERLQRSLEMESEIPKKALLQKISLLRRERQALTRMDTISNDAENVEENSNCNKQRMILDTIESLKRNLEDQSLELYGLNDPE